MNAPRNPSLLERLRLQDLDAGSAPALALRAIMRLRAWGIVVLLPLVVLAFYYAVMASDGYLGKAQVLVQRQQSSMPQVPELALFGLGNDTSKQDALLISTFMQSRAMLDHLQGKLDLRAHYSSDDVDYFSSLSPDASGEDFLKYYRKRLGVAVDDESYIVTFQFEAFTPEFAEAVSHEIVRHSEIFVNGISQKLAREQIDFIQGELVSANTRLRTASSTLIGLQREHTVFSAEAETATIATIIAGLETQLAQARTQLKTLQSYLNDNTAEVIASKKQIAALERQVAQERSRQVGKTGMNDLMLQYKEAEMNVTLASDLYSTGLKALETARLDASRKVEYLVLVSPPVRPDEAELPRGLRSLAAAFLLLNLLYFVFTLIRAAISDHMD